MKLTLSALALIAAINAPAFADGFTFQGCAMKQIANSNAYTSVEPGCLTAQDGSKGEYGATYTPPEPEAPAETPTKS